MTLSKECVLVKQPCVMLVDGLSETEEVLKAVLEPRGTRVTRVRSMRSPDSVLSQSLPSVVVVHESERLTHPASNRLNAANEWGDVPRVVIGRLHSTCPSTRSGCRYLAQPFEYAELVTVIESLLPSA